MLVVVRNSNADVAKNVKWMCTVVYRDFGARNESCIGAIAGLTWALGMGLESMAPAAENIV